MGLLSPAADPAAPTNKQPVLLFIRKSFWFSQALTRHLESQDVSQSGPSGPTCSEDVGSRPRIWPRGVSRGSSTSGSSSCSISLGRERRQGVSPEAALASGPRTSAWPAGRSPVHRSLDALVPCEGQSLLPGGRNTESSAHQPWGQSGRARPPHHGLGEAPLRASPGKAHLDEALQGRQLRHGARRRFRGDLR